MGTSFAPYRAEPLPISVVEGVSSLQSWRDLLLVGRSDGSLTVLQESQDIGNPSGSLVWKTLSVKRLGQQILQLAASADRNLLFCLTEQGVNLYSLPQLLLKGQADRTRGGACFAWDDATNLLAVAVKKRVIVYKYDGLEFVYHREIPAAEQPLALHILGQGTVCICTKREYILALPSGTLQNLQLPSEAEHTSGPCGFAAGPKEVIVTQKDRSYLIDDNGKLISSKTPIKWSQSPSAVVVSGAHVIALLPGIGLEVQLYASSASVHLSQMISLKSATMIAAKVPVGVYSACKDTGQIFFVGVMPSRKQAEQLLDAGAYEDALAVCRSIEDDAAKTELESRIRLAYGKHLLSEHRYEEAMLNLGMSMCDPRQVLCSFPFLVPTSLALKAGLATELETTAAPSQEEIGKIVAIVTPYLLSYRSKLASGAVDSSESASWGGHGVRLDVLIDTALLNAFLVLPDNGALLQFVQRPNSIDLDAGSEALKQTGRYAELVFLYKAHGRHGAALDMLKQLTISPDELEIAPQGAAVNLKGLPGAWRAVQYLSEIFSANNIEDHAPRDFSLISSHARWILDLDAEAGIDLFVRLYPDIDPSVILPILSFKTELSATYLQQIVEAGAEERTFHQDLAILYLQDEKNHEKLRNLIMTSDYLDYESLLRLLPPKGLWEIRAALLERLERHLDALRIYVHCLNSVPSAEAYCDRVSKQRPVGSFIKTLTSPLPDAPLLPGEGPVYALLIQVMLEEQDKTQQGVYRPRTCGPDDARWTEIAELLSRKRNALHPLHALSLLPQQVPLTSCVRFLEGAIRGTMEERKKAALVANLYRARHLTALSNATNAEQKCLVVSQDRACWMCHKRLGSGAMVHLPSGVLAHYSCFRKSELASIK